MKVFLSMIIVVIFSVGCKKSDSALPNITGKWELRKSSGGFANIDLNFTEGNGNAYQFNSDRTYRHFLKDTIDARGTYTIKPNQSTIFGTAANIVYFDNDQAGLVVELKNDSLALGNNYADGITNIYVRIQ